jgi:hypothetical protein
MCNKSSLRDIFHNYQRIEYKGKRYIVDYVDRNEVYITSNLKDFIKFKFDDKELNFINILEPLLNKCIEQEKLIDISYLDNDKYPHLSIGSENLISKIKPSDNYLKCSYSKDEWLSIEKNIKNDKFTPEVEDWIKSRMYKNFTIEDIAKLSYSFMYSSTNNRHEFLNEHNPTLWVLEKIKSSYWHTSLISDNWNQVVDSYKAIKNFRIDKKDFSIKLDTTTYHNEKGYSRFNNVYLDGIFSYVLYYKNKPVMNISFNITCDKKGNNVLQLTQLQCVNNKGNRWIYKFGHDYVEQIVNMFMIQFPKHKIQLRKAESLEIEIRDSYEHLVNRKKKNYIDYLNRKKRNLENDDSYLKNLNLAIERKTRFETQGVESIKNSLGYRFKSLRRVRCNNRYNTLITR